ncbi:MAG: phosphoenolpyruvate synthase [Candidatus Paceibacterota bacterium]
MLENNEPLLLWFDQINNNDVEKVGGKNASLGEMYTTLAERGIRVPNGFVITAEGYKRFINEAGLEPLIRSTLENLDTSDIKALQKAGKKVREAIIKADLSPELNHEIETAYNNLSAAYGQSTVDVAVRSSATAEDLPGASFAGEHDTYLNIVGIESVLKYVKHAMSSLFNDRAISYRQDKGFDHFDVALSVGVQKMVRSDKGVSGVMFTLDTESGFRDVVQISAAYGLGEMVVQGKVNPDEYLVFKPTLSEGFRPVIKKTLGAKGIKMIYNTAKEEIPTKEVETNKKERDKYALNDDEILTLARWGAEIERHYSERSGHPSPMDIEWAKDGESGELFIVQARPETIHAENKGLEIREYHLHTEEEHIAEGIAVGTKIASGKARVIDSVENIHDFKEGEILVTEITDPDWEPIMKIASAIVTEKGGRTSHAAIVSRELGIPAVIGVPNARKVIKNGQQITCDTSSGTVGKIYKGKLEWEELVHKIDEIPETKTKISMNIGSPESAFVYSSIPNDGVGLAREEFVIASHIKAHPLALLNYRSESAALKKKLDEVTKGHEDKRQFYVDKLAEGVGQIASAFYPKQVIVRFSDFKTNEYATLIGGAKYEPEEENPMIGWRGASRYAHPDFTEAFKMECEAMKKIREEFGLKNLAVMVPFCRTPEEGQRVLEIMAECGLAKGHEGLKVYVMCELPTNVLRADHFLDIFDGFSIGSNDLAQLTLGLDRDSSIVAGISDEKDPSVKSFVSEAIKKCHERGKYIGFCGQAPSDYKDFLRFLIQEKIDSVSLIPDTIIPMKFEVRDEEQDLQDEDQL